MKGGQPSENYFNFEMLLQNWQLFLMSYLCRLISNHCVVKII